MKYIKFLVLLLLVQSCSYIIPESKKYADGVVISNCYVLSSSNYRKDKKYCLEVIFKKRGEIRGIEYYTENKNELNGFVKYTKLPVYKTWNGKVFVMNEDNERIYFVEPEFICLNDYEDLFEITISN